jgi:hypothetical protein
MKKSNIGCAAFDFGVVCAKNKGHGFFLNRANVNYF